MSTPTIDGRPFPYLRDPLFQGCATGYLVNRLFVRPHVGGGFFHDSFNDVICIPLWVPIMLAAMRRLGLRAHDGIPTWYEVALPLMLWSYAFEVLLPGVRPLAPYLAGDPNDVLCYSAGALLACLFWRRWYGAESAASR